MTVIVSESMFRVKHPSPILLFKNGGGWEGAAHPTVNHYLPLGNAFVLIYFFHKSRNVIVSLIGKIISVV